MTNQQQDAYNHQKELAKEQQLRDVAATQAAQPDMLRQLRSPQYLETLGDVDIGDEDNPDDDLESLLATETSRWNLLANYDDEEYEKRKLLSQNTAERIKSEYPRRAGPGSKCVGAYRRILTGQTSEANRPILTDQMARRIDAAVGEESARTAQMSASKGGKGWDGLTQIQTNVMTEDGGSSSGSNGGLIGGAKNLLFGNGGD